MVSKIWFITGVARGLGHAIASAALDAGDVVIGTARGDAPDLPNPNGRLHVLKMDLADPEAIRDALDRAFAIGDRIDVLVNNAGYPLFGAVEEAADPQVTHLFDVNVHGPRRVIQAALPRLRRQGSGHIVNITSVGAYVTLSGYGHYAACKAAMESLTEVLATEVAALGIKVTAVAPGAFRTEFVSKASVTNADAPLDMYPQTRTNIDNFWTNAGKQIGDPEKLGAAIVDLVKMADPPTRLLLGSDAVSRVREHTKALLHDIDAHTTVSASTDFTDQ